MAETSYRLGMGQILVEDADPAANLERAVQMVRCAAARGCRITVLPECLDLGWTSESAPDLAQPVPGSRSEVLCAAAKQHQMYVAAGLTERAGGRVYNTAILISPDGEILLKHRKINELTIAHHLYSSGTSVAVAETELGLIGLDICADNFPNSLVFAHSMARMGAQLIVSPCAWAVDADHDNSRQRYGALWREAYGAIARLYDVTIVGVSSVGWLRSGPWKGRKCIGCSLAIGPGGQEIAQGPYGERAEALTIAEIKIRKPLARGTEFAQILSARGYTGP